MAHAMDVGDFEGCVGAVLRWQCAGVANRFTCGRSA